jgi:predicted secreted Zn-dependent protease
LPDRLPQRASPGGVTSHTFPGVTTSYSENWTTYDVSGATLADVADAISHLPEAGSCTWHPTFSYTTGEDGKVDSFTVTCEYTYEMPVWTDKSSASPEAQAEWDRWYAALEEHEKGHYEATAWMFDCEADLIGMDPAEAEAQFGKFVYDAQQASDRYDADTDHGRNTGTNMDVDIP